MFSIGERSGLKAGQFSTLTLLIRSHAVVIAAVCDFALSRWKTRRLGGRICCSKTFIYLSAFIVPSKTCKVPIPYALMHSHTIRDAGFWTEHWWHVPPLYPSLFHDFQQECQIWIRLTIEHFSSLKQSILKEPWPTGHDGASGPCSHMASFLHDRALDGTANCVYWQWFLEVFLGPCINVNDRIMLMSDAVSSEGQKTTGILQRSSALSLTHRDFSSFSESFDDVMHCKL